MRRLLVDETLRPGGRYRIRGEELRYLTRVLRHRVGDVVELRDDTGARYLARVLETGRDEALVEATEELPAAPTSWPLELVVAVPKRQLMDGVVRQLSELGVERLVPCVAERSTVRPGENKLERWRRIAAESRRQCGRDLPLEVSRVLPLAQALEELADGGTRFILHNGAVDGFPSRGGGDAAVGTPLGLAVGPEGGFTGSETDLASRLGFIPAGLGDTVLRTETAAVAAAVLGLALLGAFEK